jgi:hypothetical protein
MSQYSPGVVLLQSLASAEAQHGKCRTIVSAHLLLGLCKICDMSLADMLGGAADSVKAIIPQIEREVDQVRQVFVKAHLDTTAFRRRLRAALGQGDAFEDAGEPSASLETRQSNG